MYHDVSTLYNKPNIILHTDVSWQVGRAGTARFVLAKLGLEMAVLHPVSLAAFFLCTGLGGGEPPRDSGP
jgi:hypothetical protein